LRTVHIRSSTSIGVETFTRQIYAAPNKFLFHSTMESSEEAQNSGNNVSIQIQEENPLAGLQRPVPHARRTDSKVALSNLPPPPSTCTITAAPMIDTTTNAEIMTTSSIAAAVPMIDTTKFGRSSSARQRSFTARIEGMEKLKTPLAEDDENLTEAEKRMREEELSFYTSSVNEHGDDNIWGLLSGVGGNIYEWYVDDHRNEE
jgi:hypothetical protein